MQNLKQIAVITTASILERKANILIVVHDDDGDWQFLSGENIVESEARVLSLVQIISIDPTIKNVLSMPSGASATRKSITAEWKIVRN